MDKIYYNAHLLLQSKFLPLLFLSCFTLFFNILNITALCEADNNNIIKDDVVISNNNPKVSTALTLFVISIFFKFLILPYIMDGTLLERIIEIINEEPFEEVYEPATTQEVFEWAEEWLRKELGVDHLSEEEVRALFFGKKK